MSRGFDVDVVGETRSRATASDGHELPRGGRAAGPTRHEADGPGDVRDAVAGQLALPRGPTRQAVSVGDRTYTLRGSDVRVLAAVGAFRVVQADDVESRSSRDRWHGDVERLRTLGLVDVRAQVFDGRRTAVVTLTRDGQRLLQQHQRPVDDGRVQAYYVGFAKPREIAHDAQLWRTYIAAAERLQASGARVARVVLDYELKRDYQRFLQANNRQHRRQSGRPDRSHEEIRMWATAHHLSVVDGRVRFPDVRIEYDHPDGRRDREDIELATGHYTSRQLAAKQASGFRVHHSRAGRLGGRQSRRGSAPFDPHAAEQVLR